MFDHWLDAYEDLWRPPRTSPDLFAFLSQLPPSPELVRELVLIDLEHRWRSFYTEGPIPGGTDRMMIQGLPRLPRWEDYYDLLPFGERDWVGGWSHEFRVRQSFGDRPDYREFVPLGHPLAPDLDRRLPEIAAELSGAIVSLLQEGGVVFSCRLPGRVEVGRRQVDEPPAPGLFPSDSWPRLVVCESDRVRISRAQLRWEVVSRGRLWVQHLASKGYVDCLPGRRLTGDAVCELDLPCQLVLKGYVLRIEPAVG